MACPKWVPPMFWLVALYDGLLGAAFLIAAGPLYDAMGVTPANHLGYVQFPAALLIVFAVMFARVAMNPPANRELMLYGVGLKLSYLGVVLGHWAFGSIPTAWIPLALCDLVWAMLFIAAWVKTAPPPAATDARPSA
ncbi:MAG: hypothetical protein H6810_11730 [Phycisphaeraceae bacterium]|nr:MAG: hypothetical protein H6810_11730 [Phycisphaeraceae bacterium]